MPAGTTHLNPCQYGSEPAPSTPPFFRFSEADLIATMGLTWYSLVSLDLLGVPVLPVESAAFCAEPPPIDFPVQTDYALLAFPPLAIAAGAYQRFNNLIQFNKWTQIAVCKNAPPATGADAPPDGYVSLWSNVALTLFEGQHQVVWDGSPLPVPNVAAVAWRIVGTTLTDRTSNTITFGVSTAQQLTGSTFIQPSDNSTPCLSNWMLGRDGDWIMASIPTHGHYDGAAIDYNLGQLWPFVQYISRDSGTYAFTFDLAYLPKVPDPPPIKQPPPPPPPIEQPPDGFIPPDAPPDCSLQSLCTALGAIGKKLDAVSAFVQHGNAALVPITPERLGNSIVPQPVDTNLPPGTPSVPLQPIPKPVTAVGAVVQVTTIPLGYAHYGEPVAFWPDLGHVIMLTDYGPLPSQLIKHNPLVLLPIPQQVTSLVLDLGLGVLATVQFLNAPK